MKEDILKTAATTPFGLFERPLMNFGLLNAAQTFQWFMDRIMRRLVFVIVSTSMTYSLPPPSPCSMQINCGRS